MSQVWVREYEAEKATKKTEIERFVARLPEAFRREPVIQEGNPAEQILLAIRQLDIDLVVIGKQIKGRLDRLLLGSTSEKVLHNAPCSVLVVPE
ncbi:MAG: universal stress protein [Pirellulales bacterium]